MSLTYENRMTVAAHRGDSYNYYENTLSAFKGAIDSGADMIETDVHLTKDNELVLIHDDKVDRTTNGHGYVRDFTLGELLELNAGDIYSHEKIPTLKELFELIKDTDVTLNIEIKEYHLDGNEKRCELCIDSVLKLVSKYGLDDRILINSFDAGVLEYVYKKHGKKYALHGFYPYREMFNISLNPDEYLYCACIFEKDKSEHYEYLKSKGIQPWIGASITQKACLEMCLKYGARLITTNNPADIIKKLKEIQNGRK